MTETESQLSPLTRLVLFMVCLSIVGGIVAGAYWAGVEKPRMNSVEAPQNSWEPACMEKCRMAYQTCSRNCGDSHPDCKEACMTAADSCSETCRN